MAKRLFPPLPTALFGALTLFVFHGVLFQGRTMVTVSVLERQLGRAPQEPSWIKPRTPPVRVADNGALLPMLLKHYNEGRLWNPSQFCGYPLTYDTMVHPFYPPNALLHRVFSWSTAYHAALLLHFFTSAWAMFHLLRALGRSEAAATFGGLLWILFGYNALWFASCVHLGTSVFAPLALLAIVRGLERRSLAHAGWAGAAMGMSILGSHPQFALLIFLFLLAWIAARGEARFALVFAALSVGVGLPAVLTRLDSLANGWRDPSADILSIYADETLGLLNLVAGRPENPYLAYELAVHAGLAATLLAFAGAIRGWRESSVRFVAIFTAAALLAAFFSPLARLLAQIPGMNLSPPSRWIYVAGFGLAMLAARGVDALRDGVGPWRWIAAGVAALTAVWHFRSIETLVGMALAVAAAFMQRKGVAVSLLFAALLVDLLPPFYFGHNWPLKPVEIAREFPEGRVTGLVGATPHETDFYLSDLVEGEPLLASLGAETIGGFEAILPAHYVAWARAAGAMPNPAGRSLTWTRFDSPLLDMAGLKTLYLPPNLDPGPRFERVRGDARVVEWRNPRAFPRAWVVGRAEYGETLDVDFRTTATLDDVPPPLDPEVRGTARRLDANAWEVETGGAGLLVVTETWDAGWSAEVDGRPARVYRANGAFRAVPVGRGRQVVRFSFRPRGMSEGLIGGAFFLALALGWPLIASRRRPAPSPAPPGEK